MHRNMADMMKAMGSGKRGPLAGIAQAMGFGGGAMPTPEQVKALAEIIKPDVTGALTIPQDSVALADTLELLVCSTDIRRKLGEAAREWVARDRTWAQNAARYRDAYARLGAV